MAKFDSSDIALKIHNLHKSFRLPHEAHNGIKQYLINLFKGKKGYEIQKVLSGIDFEIKKGEFFGIVGRNGSGKSTLLKCMAGIYAPDSGHVLINGTLTPFIELGVGFNPELTGRENVFLNGALLGFSNEDMKVMYDDIVEFAELDRFMDQKLKNYSSGMQVRLAFSIAIRAKGDILLLDEVLAVGDTAFQQKCYSYFYQLKEQKKTVVLVTHSMAAVEKFCDKALLLEKGQVIKIGNKSDVAELYNELFIERKKAVATTPESEPDDWGCAVKVDIVSKDKKTSSIKTLDYFTVNITLKALEDIKACNVGLNLRNENKDIVFSMDTRLHIGEFSMKKGDEEKISIKIKNRYTNGIYYVGLHVVDESKEAEAIMFMNKKMAEFTSYGVSTHAHSPFRTEYEVTKNRQIKS